MINDKASGKILGVYTKTQDKVHNAKIETVTPQYFTLFDLNKQKSFKYKKTSVTSVNGI